MAYSEDELEHLDDIVGDEAPKNINKSKVLFFLVPLLIVVSVIVGIFTIFNKTTNSTDSKSYSILKKVDESTSIVFYDLPEISVYLRDKLSGDSKLRMKLTIELDNEKNIPVIETMISRLNDVVISHTIELTPSEVRGIEGLYWLKEELLYRMNLVADPVKITNLNFKSFELERAIKED